MMKLNKWILVLLYTAAFLPAHTQEKNQTQVVSVKLGGYLGERIDQCIANRIMPQDLDHIIEPFNHKSETWRWQSEFWGKWTLGACEAYKYTRSQVLLEKIKYGANELMKTQLTNGYIGNYAPENYLAEWDVWGRKYCLLGLQSYYAITKDKKALDACKRIADHLLSQVGPGQADIARLGNYRGMAAGSVLEPIVFLYNNTGDKRYLDFAKYIVGQWETDAGPRLISKALNNVPVAERFLPVPRAAQWTLNGSKAYEMMSCYVGLLELYKIVKEPGYLAAAEMTARQIMDQELTITGSASATECFWWGAKKQTTPVFLSNETCVTYTWMQLCDRLYQITGKSVYMDEVEKTAYNALQASMSKDGSNIASYVPLEGFRRIGERQCGLNFNCCEANGPRGFVLLPHSTLHVKNKTITVNLYNDMAAVVALDKSVVSINTQTNYPVTGDIELSINPDKSAAFILALRIPLWSRKSKIWVNGEEIENFSLSGTYVSIDRKWEKGDQVKLSLDMEGRLIELNNHLAIMRGPIVLARDSRFKDGFVDETIAIEHTKDKIVPLTPASGNSFAWMSFTVNTVTSIYNGDPASFRKIGLCDFGSAGNTWDEHERYRVWLPGTIETADRDTWW